MHTGDTSKTHAHAQTHTAPHSADLHSRRSRCQSFFFVRRAAPLPARLHAGKAQVQTQTHARDILVRACPKHTSHVMKPRTRRQTQHNAVWNRGVVEGLRWLCERCLLDLGLRVEFVHEILLREIRRHKYLELERESFRKTDPTDIYI